MPRDPIKDFFSTAHPNPGREGCPDPAVLRAIASNQLSATHPARLHLASCSPCFSDFRAFKESGIQKTSHRKAFAWLAAVAACLLLAIGLGLTITTLRRERPTTDPGPLMARIVDLSNYGALRGSNALNQLEAVSLPSARVKLTVILPKLSDAGTYKVSVSRDRSSDHVLASGAAAAQGSDQRRTVTVLLDLRGTHPGSYFLATTHDKDEASYFYPLRIETNKPITKS